MSETRHGFVCANAGVDLSNVARGYAALLPLDSDRSARRIRDGLRARLGVTVGVLVSDTFGRAWRRGVTDVAIGVAGVAGVVDLRGTQDAYGRTLMVTEVCVADEIAGAAELVMGKSTGVPVAIVRGVDPSCLRRGFGRRRDGPAPRRGPLPLKAARHGPRGGRPDQERPTDLGAIVARSTASSPSGSEVQARQSSTVPARVGSTTTCRGSPGRSAE